MQDDSRGYATHGYAPQTGWGVQPHGCNSVVFGGVNQSPLVIAGHALSCRMKQHCML